VECRERCGACCIAITISSPIPGMPNGKAAGIRCIHLTEEHKCRIFYCKERPKVCDDLKVSFEMCGHTFEDAYRYLSDLERLTKPDEPKGCGDE